MFGDDPDPTVMTARVGSGKFRTRTQRGLGHRGQEGSKDPIGLERSMKARGDAATTSGYGFYENNVDAMRMMT